MSDHPDLDMECTFSLGDVLSVTTNRVLSDKLLDGVLDVLEFLYGPFDRGLKYEVGLYQDGGGLREVWKVCQAYVRSIYPELDPTQNADLAEALKELDRTAAQLKREGLAGKDGDSKVFVANVWIATQVARYGNEFTLRPMPHVKPDPFLQEYERRYAEERKAWEKFVKEHGPAMGRPCSVEEWDRDQKCLFAREVIAKPTKYSEEMVEYARAFLTKGKLLTGSISIEMPQQEKMKP